MEASRTRYSKYMHREIPCVDCDVCGRECTMETPLGPPTRDTDGVTRCEPCHCKHGQERARLYAAAPALLAAREAALAEPLEARAELERAIAQARGEPESK